MSDIQRTVNQGVGQVFGSGQQSGILGLGQFRTDPYKIDNNAFLPDQAEQQYTAKLADRAYGNGPSAAEMMMQRGLGQATAQSQALAASARGTSPALAQRMAAMNQANMSQNVAGQSGILRAQEQAQAMGQLGGQLQSQRTGRMGLENLASGNYNYAQGLNMQGYQSAAANRGNFMSNMGNMLQGGALMAHGGEVDPGSMNGTPNLPGGMAPVANWDIKPPEGKKPKGEGKPGDMAGGPGDAGGLTDQFVMYAASGGEINPGSMNGTPDMPGGAPVGWQQKEKEGGGGVMGLMSKLPMLMALNQGGQVPGGPSSHTGRFLMQAMSMGGPVNMKPGGQIPGQAQHAGDTIKNDTVPIMASPGEIMLPRSVTQGKNPGDKAKAFVDAIKAKGAKGKK